MWGTLASFLDECPSINCTCCCFWFTKVHLSKLVMNPFSKLCNIVRLENTIHFYANNILLLYINPFI